MKINLTVAHKIFLGFGIIVLMLFITGLFSIAKFSGIKHASTKISDTAIPIKSKSNQLQIELLKLIKLSTLSFNSQTIKLVNDNLAQFNQDHSRIKQDYHTLSELVSEHPVAEKNLKEAQLSTQAYAVVVQQMLNAIKQRINHQQQAFEIHNRIINHIDEAGTLLMELSYLEQGESQYELEQVSGVANQLDGYMSNVINTTKEIYATKNLDGLNKIQDSIEFMISNLNIQVLHLEKISVNVDTSGLLAQFLSEYRQGVQLMFGDNSLSHHQRSYLTLNQLAQQNLDESQNDANNAIQQLDALLDFSNTQFNQLRSKVTKEIDAGQKIAMITLITQTLMALFAATLTIRAMLKPLEGINNTLSHMAKGDLSQRIVCERQDEYGMLSNNIRNVVKHLTQLISRIKNNAEILREAANNSSDQITQISIDAKQQKQTVSEVTSITQVMNLSVDYITHQANTAADEMRKALKQSEHIANIADQNKKSISQLELQLEETTKGIDRLQIESNNIEGILETIGGIAEQTNLLALNAAIEAARAGDQGRGFAVVADEVRSLAGRTQQSTAEIKTLIDNLQNQTSNSVTNITKGRQQAIECVNHTDQLTQSLSAINEAINHMYDMSNQIANATSEHLTQSKKIQHQVAEAVEIADINAVQSQSTLKISAQVADLADELNSSVNSFKVN